MSDLSHILERDNYPDLILHGYTSIKDEKSIKTPKKFEVQENKGFENDLQYLISTWVYCSNAWTKIIKRYPNQ